MKKVISVLLSIIIAFSFTVTSFATEQKEEVTGINKFFETVSSNILTSVTSLGKIARLSASAVKSLEPLIMDIVLDSENWQKAGDALMKVLVKIFDKANPDNPDTPENPDSPDSPSLPSLPSITDILKDMSIEDFVNIIKKYFIINVEDIDSTSKDIVDLAEYKFVTTENGEKTVYIMVDIEKHPELLNRDLLMQTVEKLYERQNEEFSESADILMSYEHIAGELALHAILYAVTNEYLTVTGKTEGTVYDLWVRAKKADLNFDENRIPTDIIEITGIYIMGVFVASFYTLYKTLGITMNMFQSLAV